MSNGVMDNKAYKQARFMENDDPVITSQMYNVILGGTVLWGIIINIIMATLFMEPILEMNYLLVVIVYFVGSFISMMVHKCDGIQF